jgi:energy-converting hydrogenase Eha subunit H
LLTSVIIIIIIIISNAEHSVEVDITLLSKINYINKKCVQSTEETEISRSQRCTAVVKSNILKAANPYSLVITL